ncbi:MAG: Eco57I restriction-modification methylase domain-containing protein, partial [Cetobacterium sp.]
MTEKFDVVITNPPYMGGKGYTDTLKKYVEKNYKDSKADLFAVFMEQCSDFTKKERYTAMIVMQSWMFLSSFEELRKNIIEKQQIESLLQIGYGVIGIAFGTTAFCLKKTTPTDKKGNYFRMFDKIAQNIQTEDCATLFRKSAKNKEFKYKFDSYKSSEGITEELVSNSEGNLIRFQANQKDFEKIPGSPIAYWVSDREKELYSKGQTLDKIAECKKGLDTGKNEMFLRLWNEVELKKASLEEFNKDLKWFPYNKGGEFRKWYGNREYLINWENEGIMIKNRINLKVAKPTLRNLNFMLKKSFTWGTVSSSDFSARYSPEGALFDNGGCSLFSENLLYDGA